MSAHDPKADRLTGLAQTQTNGSQRNPRLPMPQSGFEC